MSERVCERRGCEVRLTGRQKRWCSSGCGEAGRHGVPLLPPPDCVVCRRPIRYGTQKAKYCSNACKLTASRIRHARDIVYEEILRVDPCVYCGAPGGTIDHITPTSAGGTSSWDNLTAACRRCNSTKQARPLLQFLALRRSSRWIRLGAMAGC